MHGHDRLTFSQREGYEEIPRRLKLEELPKNARTRICNLFLRYIIDEVVELTRFPGSSIRVPGSSIRVGGVWHEILRDKHFDERPFEEWTSDFPHVRQQLSNSIGSLPFNKVFDLIEFVLRHSQCPPNFVRAMKDTFEKCSLAYIIDMGQPPTISPAVTPEEGKTVVAALQTLRQAGLNGSFSHLRKACQCINESDWPGSIRESIHAVESVARQLDPKASKSLKPALSSLKQREVLHPALEEAFNKLYGYTSDEQGIRHALLDRTDASVGKDEALFMLGACASFTSYLWRKHKAAESS